jgi:hypothetical protein
MFVMLMLSVIALIVAVILGHVFMLVLFALFVLLIAVSLKEARILADQPDSDAYIRSNYEQRPARGGGLRIYGPSPAALALSKALRRKRALRV